MVQKLGFSGAYQGFGANGKTMVPIERVHCSKGTLIHAYGYAMSLQYFVVYDDDMNAVEICKGNPEDVNELDLERYYSPRIKVGEETQPISEKFGIGLYYDESEEISDEIIEKSLRRAENLERLAQEKKEREEKEYNEGKELCAKKYSFLERAKDRYDHNVVGRNIRTELKRNFPGVKFSVKKDGYDCYRINWTDGPTDEQVSAIVLKYKTGRFDAYQDYHYSEDSPFTDLFGGCDYVFTRREISKDAIEETKRRFPDLNEENYSTYSYDDSEIWREAQINPFETVIYILARTLDFTPKMGTKIEDKTEPISGEFSIVDYSEKAIAVTGDTKAIKDQLKKLGGRFNGKLSCGAGWIFSKKKEPEVRKLLGIA